MRRALAPSVLILASLLHPGAAWAQCPASSGTCFGPTTEPTRTAYCQPAFSGPLYQKYDLRNGLLEASGHGSGSYPGNSNLVVEDEFVIGGVGLGDTVRCAVAIELQGQIGCGGGGYAGAAATARDDEGRITEFLARLESTTTTPSPYLVIQETISLELAWAPGVTHRLRVELAVWGRGGGGSMALRYRFLRLPPSATLQSCQGFVNESPTTVRHGSWGGIKQLYR